MLDIRTVLLFVPLLSLGQLNEIPRSQVVHESKQSKNASSDDRFWRSQPSGVTASLRGLSVVDAKVVWASGTGGTVIRTIDGGSTWTAVSVGGAENLDFRDIHAWDADRAVIINAGQPARVYLTENGGVRWTQAFQHPSEKAFFDALSFWDDKNGIAMSDPMDGRVLLIQTVDGGRSWTELPANLCPQIERGEAGFAASGTNMQVLADKVIYIGLGGGETGQFEAASRIVFTIDRGASWLTFDVPMRRGTSRGIFSLAFRDSKHGIAVGGDYSNPDDATDCASFTHDGGKSWQKPTGDSVRGYRSCVAFRGNSGLEAVAVGPNGSDISHDGGASWQSLSQVGFHSVQFTRDGRAGWATGSDGRVARWKGGDE
jgi:photosystem II stability/assembly factor-like uncharacterized protein